MDTSLLRQQQITLGLLKAARVLCSRQDNLRQILNHQAESTEGGSTFSLQQLMCSAIKPSPIKALFDREELEVRLCLAISIPEIPPKKNVKCKNENQTQTRKRTTKKLYLHSSLHDDLFTKLTLGTKGLRNMSILSNFTVK